MSLTPTWLLCWHRKSTKNVENHKRGISQFWVLMSAKQDDVTNCDCWVCSLSHLHFHFFYSIDKNM